MNKIYCVITFVSCCGFSFLLGLSFFYKKDLTFFEEVKISVSSSLPYPELESFKDSTYFLYKKTKNFSIGYVCGYVSYRDNHDIYHHEFRRFFVKIITDENMQSKISIPFIEGVDDIITHKEMNELWSKYCSA